MRLTRTGASSSARLAVEGGHRGGDRRHEPEAETRAAAAGAAHEQQRAPGPHLVRRRCGQPGAPATGARSMALARLLRSPSPAGAHNADRPAVTITWSIGVGRSRKNRSSAAGSVASNAAVLSAPSSLRGALQALGIPAREDHVGSLGARAPAPFRARCRRCRRSRRRFARAVPVRDGS